MKWTPLVAAGLAAGLLSPTHAAPVTFFGENTAPGETTTGDPVTAHTAFLSTLTGVGVEDFEGIAANTTSPITLSFPGSAGDITATLSGGGAQIYNTPYKGRFATSGSNLVETDTGGSFTISFSQAISAFGFYGTDIGDFGGQLTLRLTPAGGGSDVDLVVPHTIDAADGSLLFFGFYDLDQTYTGLSFLNSTGADAFAFDDMIVGDRQQVTPPPTPTAPIPLPAAGWLLIGGLGALAALRRRRG